MHLEVLRLDGRDNSFGPNPVLRALPEALGALHALKTLTLQDFKALEALPVSIARLTSLENLLFNDCAKLHELPVMRTMTRLTSPILHDCALKQLPCLEPLTALQHLSHESLPDLTQLPSSIGKLIGLRELRLAYCRGSTQLQ